MLPTFAPDRTAARRLRPASGGARSLRQRRARVAAAPAASQQGIARVLHVPSPATVAGGSDEVDDEREDGTAAGRRFAHLAAPRIVAAAGGRAGGLVAARHAPVQRAHRDTGDGVV